MLQTVKNASIGDDLLIHSYVNSSISKVLMRVPKVSVVLLAESLLDKMNDSYYNVESLTYWLVFLTSFLFFLEKPRRSGRKQMTAMSSKKNKKFRANIVSLPKTRPRGSSPPQTDLEQRIKLINSKLDEGNIKGRMRLTVSDDKIAPFRFLIMKNCYLNTQKELI